MSEQETGTRKEFARSTTTVIITDNHGNERFYKPINRALAEDYDEWNKKCEIYGDGHIERVDDETEKTHGGAALF